MRRSRLTLVVIFALLLAMLACNVPSGVTPTPVFVSGEVPPDSTDETGDDPTPDAGGDPATEAPADSGNPAADSATNTPVPSPTPQEGPVLEPPTPGDDIFITNFGGTWPELDLDTGTTRPDSGGYLITANEFFIWAITSSARSSDFYAEITGEPRQCPGTRSAYGLLFHHEGANRHRFVAITCTGRYIVGERAGSTDYRTLIEDVLPDAITPASGSHSVGVRALDNVLTIYVDDYRLTTLTVEESPNGDFGPYVHTGDSPTVVLFTELAIYEPE